MSADNGEHAVRGPYAKTAGVRRRIIEACGEVFKESGYRATTMKAVAERAGISQRGLVHHFRNKEELLAAVLEARDEASGAGHPDFGRAEGVEDMVRTHLDTMKQPEILELHSTLSAEAIAADHPAHGYYAQRYTSLRVYLTASFDALRAEGRLHSAVDSATLASMMVALMDGLQVQWLYDPGSVDVEKALTVFLNAVVADADTPGSTAHESPDASPAEPARH